MSEGFDVVVIGAGISGLTFAHRAARTGRRVLVLEESPAAGGCIRSERLPDGFWYELGAHTLYNSYGTLIDVLTELGLTTRIQARRKAPYRLLVGDELRSVPSQLRLGELLASAWRAFSERKEGRTVADYYGRLVGPRNYTRVFSPLFAAVPSQRADAFPAEMLFKRRPRRKDVLRTFTLEGGLGTLVAALASSDGVSLRTGTAARSLVRDGGRFVVETGDGARVEAPRLALAVPPHVGATLLARLAPEVAAPLGRMQTAAIDSVGVVVENADTPLDRVAGLVPLDDVFFSAVTRDVVPDGRLRAMTFHFRPGIAPDQRLARIAAVLRVPRERFVHVATHHASLPSPTTGQAELVRILDQQLAGTGLYLTGNYFGGLAIEDCAIRSVAEARRLDAEAAS